MSAPRSAATSPSDPHTQSATRAEAASTLAASSIAIRSCDFIDPIDENKRNHAVIVLIEHATITVDVLLNDRAEFVGIFFEDRANLLKEVLLGGRTETNGVEDLG